MTVISSDAPPQFSMCFYFTYISFACIILLKSISEAHIWLCAAERCELMAALFSDNDLFESNPGGVEREFSYRRSLFLSLPPGASLNAYELPDRV